MIYAYTQRLSLSCATYVQQKALQGLGVRLVWVCSGLQERHLYSRTHFKLNRDAALAEGRQLLSA